MDFEIYCDESGLEALTEKTAHKYMAIGGFGCPQVIEMNLRHL
ncbi:hypothetical protein CLV00_0710 [Flavobacterium sp. 11]|nr:hypothetical protein CLV00_0710 [Flavobacterium sp. 11]